ncbi:cysteine synthase [Cladorrhinum sp. PSN332]|nr:cysteine synthase [Cladorrhinum sp. PSN332]
MAARNPLNVFKGPDALHRYFQPDENPPLPLVEVPDALNPLRQDGVRIFAKMLTALPAQNVKSLPALEMLLNSDKARTSSIVEASSGSTVLSLGMISRALWGHEDVYAYVTNKKPVDSLRLMRFFGLNVSLYGGLAQQEPSDPKGIMSRLRRLAREDPSVCYLGQYDNDGNWRSHEKWTGKQIWEQLPEINVLCSTVGTGGCITGTGLYLKQQKPSVKVIGVCNVFGDPTPGPRHFPGFESSPFPWRQVIDAFETVQSVDSFRMSMKLSRHGIIAGPSSGEALHGLLTHLGSLKAEGRLSELADPVTGEISCVFLCADLPYQYMDMYYKKLGEEEFPPIYNDCLLSVDQDPYEERWFLEPSQALGLISSSQPNHTNPVCVVPSSCACASPDSDSSPLSFSASPSTDPDDLCLSATSSPSTSAATTPGLGLESTTLKIIDLRPRDLYEQGHLDGAQNLDLPLTKPDFYEDAEAVRERWTQLRDAFDREGMLEEEGNKGKVLVVCGDGDSGCMSTALLRKMGWDAFCVLGGWGELERVMRRRMEE